MNEDLLKEILAHLKVQAQYICAGIASKKEKSDKVGHDFSFFYSIEIKEYNEMVAAFKDAI